MNRAAVGLGSWLIRGTENSRMVSLDSQGILLEAESYAHWKDEIRKQDTMQETQALRALIKEVWQQELSEHERRVLRALLFEKKSESELARQLGQHHSTIGRCRRRAEEKLSGGLRYVMRYRALLAKMVQE